MKIMWKKFNQLLFWLRKDKYLYISQEVLIKGRPFYVRPMEDKDIKDVLSVERDVYFGQVPWTRSAFLLELKNPMKNLYLVLQDEGKIIAFIGCRMRNRDCHITNIAVLNSHQNLGIGSFLIREIMRFAKDSKAEQLSLEVRMHNKNAQRLYRKLGFESQKVLKGYYTEVKDDGLRMVYAMVED